MVTGQSIARVSRRLPAALLLAAVMLLPAVSTGRAETPATPDLRDSERADIARIETYLNALKTVEARFLQVSSEGTYAEGHFYLSRPGRMRIEYDPPVPVLIVAKKSVLVYYDTKLKQVSYLGLDSTPAGILVGDTVSFSGPVTVTGYERASNAMRVTLVQAEDPLAGSITLVLSDRPMALRKWAVTDAQGVVTNVSLLNARFGTDLDAKLFKIRKPWKDQEEQR